MPNTNSINKKIVGWDSIDWRKVDRYVFKLQKRIYTASQQGDIKKVRKLQKTLMRSWSNKVLAVRRVTTENKGKKTAGVDGVKSLSPKARMNLVGQLQLTGKSIPTRRVWIPKPGKDEKRPLGIPTMHDRALQGVVKAALEPEWEAKFEASSYGFRPGRSCHDAILNIKYVTLKKAKYVLDADIAKCFDRINHKALLNKINYKGKVRQQLKAWLKSGVVDQGTFTAVSEGTPQGGIVSPLLANIALHGIGKMLEEYAKSIPMREDNYPFRVLSKSRKVQTLAFIRYADDFVVIHKDLEVVQKCRDLISEWLTDMGLELKPSKTRIAHTLDPEKSEDGKAGFDFLGYHIRQYSVSRHKSNKNGAGQILGFTTLITPSKSACKKHQEKIRSIFRKHKYSPQARLIQELNPVTRGWCNYYSFSDATTSGEFYRQDYLVFLKIRAWGRHRCRSKSRAFREYFRRIGSRKWVFATKGANPYKLLSHGEFECSSTQYVKVRGNKSPYDGDLFYWSARMGRNPEMPKSKAIRLKKQKGKCKWCELHFREGDILEEDHIVPLALNGKNTIDNLQLLHRHCHDAKTALDLIDIRDNRLKGFFKKLTEEWSKVNFLWISDMPVVLPS